MITFTLLDESNTARVTLSDPRPNNYHMQSVDVLADVRSIANAIAGYARMRKIPLQMVQVSTVFPAGRKLYKEAQA